VRQRLAVLLEKCLRPELSWEVLHQGPQGYRVTDVFFGHWLAGG
jgi:hypothetical protein